MPSPKAETTGHTPGERWVNMGLLGHRHGPDGEFYEIQFRTGTAEERG